MNAVACASGVELLMDYLEGVLPTEVIADLEAHVARCARCISFVRSYQETPRILRDATAVALPSDLEESIRAFLRQLRP